jgi:hypothetical protein
VKGLARAIVGGLAVVLAIAGAGDARAEQPTPDQTGWWFVAQQLPKPLPALPSPATVPSGGLYVSYAADGSSTGLAVDVPVKGTVAYGAVHYTVTAGASGTLALDVSTGSNALTASLQACRTAGSWTPVDAGSWYDQPGYESGGCQKGSVSSDGLKVTFGIPSEMTIDGFLDLAIAPVAGATPFSVSFDPPRAGSLTAAGGGPATEPAPSGTAAVGGLRPGAGSTFAPSPSPSPSPSSSPSLTLPMSTSPAEIAAAPFVSPAPIGAAPASPLATRGPSGVHRAAALTLLGSLVVAWWWLSEPGRTFVFAAAADGRRHPGRRAEFGVGRFARPRRTRSRPL